MTPKGIDNSQEPNVRKRRQGKKPVPSSTPKTVLAEPEVPAPPLPHLVVPDLPARPSDVRKWCVKNNVPVINPTFAYYIGDQKVAIPPDASFVLQKNNVVRLISKSSGFPDWSGITYDVTGFRAVDNSRKDWVTTRVAGWVNNEFLDEYHEDFPGFKGVLISHQTRFSGDAEQVLLLPDADQKYDEFNGRKFNMCGELSIAFILHKDIDTVLADWQTHSPAIFESMVGVGHDQPLEQMHMEDILKMYDVQFERYVPDLTEVPPRTKIPLAASNDLRRASAELQDKLKESYLITNLRINTRTGELVKKGDEDRNHWVVLERVTRNGSRIELYNPFPNKRQIYSFGEFYNSVGTLPNRGWWIKKAPGDVLGQEVAPHPMDEFEVAIDNPTPSMIDAEQYMYVDGEPSKKNMLCGEFCVSYILGRSLEKNLKLWLDSHRGQKPELWELARVLHAYGFNYRKYVVKDAATGLESIKYNLASGDEYFRSFSIDTVLKYWKAVQPALYQSILSNGNDTGTGPDDLKTILMAYGYENPGDVTNYSGMYGELLAPPGRDREMLKTHYLIASVKIETDRGTLIHRDTPESKNAKPKKTALHWVIVTNVTPVGTLEGGNGGWVELYNPFSNGLEEYSYKEFRDSYTAPGLWVKKEIVPRFSPQKAESPKVADTASTGETGGRNPRRQSAAVKTMTLQGLLNEIEKMRRNGKSDDVIPALLFSRVGGWSKDEIKAQIARLQPRPASVGARPADDLENKLIADLQIKSLPSEIVTLVRKTSNGDMSFAREFVNSLRESGILFFENGQTGCLRDFPAPREASIAGFASAFASTRSSASTTAAALTDKVINTVMPLFVTQVMDAIGTIQTAASLEAARLREEANRQTVFTREFVPAPTYRVMWDWERDDFTEVFRPNLPGVFRCGEIQDNSIGHYVPLTSAWQFFWFDLCSKVYYGRYHQDLKPEEYEFLANKWTGLGGDGTAFTNWHGLDKYRNYVLKERMTVEEPMIYTLVCGGASIAGTPVFYSKGKKKQWMLKVACFNGNRPPPPVQTIDPYTDPRVLFATTITPKRVKQKYNIQVAEPDVNPIKFKTKEIPEGYAVNAFPQFKKDGKLVDCPVPIVAASDIYFPMKYLVPIKDGKKANPYFPPVPQS